MTMDPSPTAEATRFIERYLASPPANTPGMLVSSTRVRHGSRPRNGRAARARSPACPLGSSQAARITGLSGRDLTPRAPGAGAASGPVDLPEPSQEQGIQAADGPARREAGGV